MKKRVLFVVLALLLVPLFCRAEHAESCRGDHNTDIRMLDHTIEAQFQDDPWEWYLDGWNFFRSRDGIELSGGYPEKSEVLVLPDKIIFDNRTYAISAAKQHEGGYDGMLDFLDGGTTVLVIPDSYSSVGYIGCNMTLQYVSLPNNADSYGIGFRAASLFEGNDVTWLVVEGSPAHNGLVEAGIKDYLFREEYCCYCDEKDGTPVFSPERFARAIPSMKGADSSANGSDEDRDNPDPEGEKAGLPETGTTLSVTEENLLNPPLVFAFADGNGWGLADESGRVLTESVYSGIKTIGRGLFITLQGDRKGLYSAWGKILDTEWDEIDPAGTEAFILKKDADSYIFNIVDGQIYRPDGPEPFSDDGKLIFFFTEESPYGYAIGLYDSRGNVLWPADFGNTYHLFDDGRIGIRMDGGSGKPYAVLLNPDGTVRYTEEEAPSSWWWSGVPVLAQKDRWTVFFDQYSTEVNAPDQLLGVMEGWWTADHRFVTVAEAKSLGLKEPDSIHASSLFIHYDETPENCVICTSAPTGSYGIPAYLHPNRYKIPMDTSNGYTILYGPDGYPPFYVSAEGTRLTNSSDSHNGMIARMNRVTGLPNGTGFSSLSMTLAPASADGIGSGELFSNGNRYFYWFRIEDPFAEDPYILYETSQGMPAGMSLFEDGSAILYSAKGKAGMIDEQGNEQLPMIYDRIENHGDYALAFIASDSDNKAFQKALQNSNYNIDDENGDVVYLLSMAENAGEGIFGGRIRPDRSIHAGETWLYHKPTGSMTRLTLGKTDPEETQ